MTKQTAKTHNGVSAMIIKTRKLPKIVKSRKKIKTVQVDLPAVYASALINNDYSAWSDSELDQLLEIVSYYKVSPARCLSVSEETWTGWTNCGIYGLLATYTFEHTCETCENSGYVWIEKDGKSWMIDCDDEDCNAFGQLDDSEELED